MPFTIDPMIGGLQTVLDLRLQQHALTASNIANADTPGYHAKVIDFRTILSDAMGGKSQLARTEPGHFGAGGADLAHPPILELAPPPWALDDNSVVPERETARLQSNALLYQAVTEGLDKKLAMLKFASSDGRV